MQRNLCQYVDYSSRIYGYVALFTDLIIAYKGLNKEKEALEASVTALSTAPAPAASRSSQEASEGATEPGTETQDGDNIDDPLNAQVNAE